MSICAYFLWYSVKFYINCENNNRKEYNEAKKFVSSRAILWVGAIAPLKKTFY